MKPLICFLGLHGTGKTTVATLLAQKLRCVRLSVGDMARLARKGGAEKNDIPTKLLVLLARSKPGQLMNEMTSEHLVSYLNNLRKTSAVIIDGFPACPTQIASLDGGCCLIEVSVCEALRHERLLQRSETTVRTWKAGLPSVRDELVSATSQASKIAGVRHLQISNDGTDPLVTAHAVGEWLQAQKLFNTGS